jgi:creatinine amidohydrolase
MRIGETNWQGVAAWLEHDDRAVLPLGSTEQHAQLSLSVDSILSERVALEAAEPLGIPVFPVVAYGITPYFRGYPGTISLRVETYLRVVADILACLREQGFRRIMIVNGHGGNAPASSLVPEFMADHPDTTIRFHNWWNAPRTLAKVQSIDTIASHASWMENFPWTRLPGSAPPTQRKPLIERDRLSLMAPEAARRYLGDGNFGGYYERPEAEMLAIWAEAVAETRSLLEGPWS